MGRISKGILGGFSGTVGTVVGGNWKGIDYMRSQSKERSGELSPAQEEQHEKFRLMLRCITSMTALVMVTFRNYAIKMTGYNSAMSYNMKNAITGTPGNYSIDFPMLLVSRGDLPNATGISANASGTSIEFKWTDNSGMGKAKATDKTVLAVYCDANHQTIYKVGGSSRADGAETLDCSPFAGETVQVYIGFISDGGKEIASSFYAGALSV